MSCVAFIPLKSKKEIEFHFQSTIRSGSSNRNRLKILLKIWISSQSSQVEKYLTTVKLGIKELLNKEQIGFKELFTDLPTLSYHKSTVK